jgi:biotin carboxyl carrier protein
MASGLNGPGDGAKRRGASDAERRSAPGADRGDRTRRIPADSQEQATDLLVSFSPGTTSNEPPAVITVDSGRSGAVDADGRKASITVGEPPRARLTTATGSHTLLATPLPNLARAAAGVQRLEVVVDGWRFELDVESAARARLRERATSVRAVGGQGGPSEVRAIIPGRVISVDVAEGDAVEAGGRLLVLEAMKMQNEVRAPRGGTVARLAVGPGQTVELGDVLLVIE